MTARAPLRIRVRRATEADSRAVLDFTRGTWGGHDYLPEVWASWLRARDGVVLAAEAADHPTANGTPSPEGVAIAVARIAMLTPDEAWMEGLRVNPAFQTHGVATALQVAELAWAQAQGAVIVRYATGEMNQASLRLGTRHGFEPAGRWRALRPPDSTAGETGGVEERIPWRAEILDRLARAGLTVSPRHLEGPRRRLSRDSTFLRGGELYEWRAWAWQALTADRLEGHVERGELLATTVGREWATGLLAHERHFRTRRLALLGGQTEPALRLIEDVATAAERLPSLRLPDPSPLLHELAPRLRAAGWTIGEQAVVLMARALIDEAGAPLPLPEDGAERLEFTEPPRPLGLLPAT